MAVDQQIDGALHGQRANVNFGATRNAQRLRRQVDHHHVAGDRVINVALGVTATGFLNLVGGVDLQQEAALDLESIPAVDQDRLGPGAADLQAAVDA